MKFSLKKKLFDCLCGVAPLKLQRRRNRQVIIIMMVLCFTQITNAQNHHVYSCRCNIVGYGCGGNTGCLTSCSRSCRPRPVQSISAGRKALTDLYENILHQSLGTFSILPPSGTISQSLSKDKGSFIKPINPEKQFTYEWDGVPGEKDLVSIPKEINCNVIEGQRH